MKQYLELLQKILDEGVDKEDRTGTGTMSIFGHQMTFNMADGFPLLTTKKLHLKSIIHELLWFLSGDTDIKYLQDNGVKIWNNWAKDGKLGPVYGKQWRSWDVITSHEEEDDSGYDSYYIHRSIDQIQELIFNLKNNPDSRRLIVSAWNVADLPDEKFSPQSNVTAGKMALAPCHLLFQFYTRVATAKERILYAKKIGHNLFTDENEEEVNKTLNTLCIPKRFISLQMYQRSADAFLGVPYNIASYFLLLMMVGSIVDMIPDKFIYSLGDAHIYKNHIDQVKLQLKRQPMGLPDMYIDRYVESIDDFSYDSFMLENYKSHDHIKGDISV